MKFNIDRDELQRGLARVQSIVEHRGTLPILSNTLITASRDGVRLAATDLEVGVVARLPAEVAKPGTSTLGAKKLYEIVREIEDTTVLLQTEDETRVRLESGASRFTLLAISPAEYPTIATGDGVSFVEIEAPLLSSMIAQTLYATSTDETRYNLNGVFAETIDGGRLRLVATDGHRLAKIDRALGSAVPFLTRGIIIPRKGVAEIQKLCDETDGGVEIGLSPEGFLVVRRPDLLLSCRLIEGDFPNYRQVLPKDQKVRLVLSRERLLHAVKRVSLLTHERTRGFKLVLEADSLELSATNPDLGEVREVLPVEYRGARFETGVNARYALDALGAMASKESVLEFTSELDPIQIRPADDLDHLALIMPMRQ
jgi:DNA polymerase-3 subunit beta